MCGRINFKLDRQTKLALRQLGIDPRTIPDNAPPSFNVAPTEAIPVVHILDGRREWHLMRWWLHPHWSREEPNQKYSMFNARMETLETSRAFKGPFQYRRCIVPVSSFVEWKREDGHKEPYLLEAERGPLLLAGIWDQWREELMSCAIVTQPSDTAFEAIHDRMPVTLTIDQAELWLNHDKTPAAILQELAGTRVALKATPVSTDINNAREKIEPTAVGDSFLIS